MITAIDTNVVAALLNADDALNSIASSALYAALTEGALVISAPVFSELLAFPNRDEAALDEFLGKTEISVDWHLEETIWRTAGLAFRSYARRRVRQGSERPRRILADFVIGAHALTRGYSLLTLDKSLYKTAFPNLRLFDA
ncbi:MAG: PIN domain-containing protein [Pyrinomonadaceae bacterium]|nr:PIN domain-containing protein [Pyrinomonadaceae bacterium]